MGDRLRELEKVRQESFDALDREGGNGILALPTGVGKTKITIDYLSERGAKNVLWVVPTEKLRDVTVPDEFRKWNKEDLLENTETICYASLGKVRGKDYHYIVLDETHRITFPKVGFFKNNMWSHVIALSATPPKEEEKQYILHDFLKLNIVKHMDLNEAITRGLVSPYKVLCVGLELDDKTIYPFKRGKRTYKRTEYTHYMEAESAIQYKKDYGLEPTFQDFIKRKRHLSQLPGKLVKAKEILNKIKPDENTRTLIFSGNIEAANSLSPHRFHSRDKKGYDKFNNKEVHELSVVNAANEGLNFVDIDVALITQIDSNPRHLTQRIGRSIRYREGHQARIIILYYKGTQDQVWVNQNLEELGAQNVIWHD